MRLWRIYIPIQILLIELAFQKSNFIFFEKKKKYMKVEFLYHNLITCSQWIVWLAKATHDGNALTVNNVFNVYFDFDH